MEKVRAKFVVQSISGNNIKLATQYDPNIPEDQRFVKATPWGNIEMGIDNPSALEFLKVGRSFYVDFIPTEAAIAAG